MSEQMPEYIKKKMQQDMRNDLNRIRMEDSKIIWETDALEQNLKAEASYIALEEKKELDQIYDNISNKTSHVELDPEIEEALSSIFAE